MVSRRTFISGTIGVLGIGRSVLAAEGDLPAVDLHTHLDNSTIQATVERSRNLGVKFGVVEHAGTKENDYPVVLSNDEELSRYLTMLEPHGVYKGVQAEWIDWPGCFSKKVLARLDYILTDAMTVRGPGGKRTKMWLPGFDPGEPQKFMDMYVDWHVEIMATTPINIMANMMFMPTQLKDQTDALWTERRMQKVIDAAIKHQVALEISSSYKSPNMAFLKLAKAAGARFSFGSNGRGDNQGKIQWSVDTARQVGLTLADLYVSKGAKV